MCLTDGRGGRWAGTVRSAGDGQVLCQVDGPLPQAESPVRITLYQGLPKADKLELIAQKAAELGVAALYPVAMTRSVVRWNQREADKKRERLERIAQEALKQCGRSRLMQVGPLLSWGQALAAMAAHSLMILPWEEATQGRMAQLSVRFPQAQEIGILIGPEGGITRKRPARRRRRGRIPSPWGPASCAAKRRLSAPAPWRNPCGGTCRLGKRENEGQCREGVAYENRLPYPGLQSEPIRYSGHAGVI